MFKDMWNPTTFIENIDPFGGSDSKESICNQETLVRSLGREDPPEKGMAAHLQYSCLMNSMDRGAWQATVYSRRVGHD